MKYYNGVAHIRGDEITNFDLTGLGDFGGADELEDSLMYLFDNFNYASSYDYVQTTLLDDTSGYWLSPVNTRSIVAEDGSIWFGNHSGIYHYSPPGTDHGCSEPTWSDEWLIYPNPVDGNSLFVIGVDPDAEARIEVYAMDGQLVRAMLAISDGAQYLSFMLRTDQFAKGAYTITLRQGARVVSTRFVVQ